MRRHPSTRPAGASRAGRRLVLAVAVSVGAVLAATVVPSGALAGITGQSADRTDAYKKAYVAKAKNTQSAAQGSGTVYLPDGSHVHPGAAGAQPHNHNDPKTKNAVSRSATVTDADTADPTTPAQARQGVSTAAAQRAQRNPSLSSAPVTAAHAASPTNRYNMFNACYGLQSSRTGRWLAGASTPTFTASSLGAGAPLYFKPTTLGRYLLYSRSRR